MSLHQIYFIVLTALVLMLAGATIWGQWLEAHTLENTALARARQLNSRVRSAWFIVLWFGAAFMLGTTALVVLFAFASFFALREFVALTPIRPSDHWALVLAFYGVIPLQYILVATGQHRAFTVFIPVYMFLALPVIMALRQDTHQYLQRIAKVQWGLMICVYCVSHAPAIASLHWAGYSDRGPLLLLYFLLLVQLADLSALLSSRLCERIRWPQWALWATQVTQSNSSKCHGGCVAGGLLTTAIGAAFWWVTPFSFWQTTWMAAATVCAGYLGEWVLASVKTSLGAPDGLSDGQLTRGMLQRLHALSFAAPVFFHLALLFNANKPPELIKVAAPKLSIELKKINV